MKLTLIMILVFLSGSAAYAQAVSESALPVGTAIDRVVIPADPSQSYAAYIPTTYSVNSPSAVIYCFDPLARGKFALDRFQTAAEKYGYIVVCSNNSHNGQEPATATRVIAALENDVRRRFNIDPTRVYAAGFSGGARLAVSLASSCGKCVAGVLAAGAGFPPNIQPTDHSFAFFGAVGIDDFNYGEMRDLQAKLEALSVNYRIDTFTGGHEWLDAETADAALAWFNLLAMKHGSLSRNERFINEQFERQRTDAEKFIAEGRHLDAYHLRRAAALVFDGVRDVASFRENAERIKRTREFRREVDAEKELIAAQRNKTEEIFDFWSRGESQYGDALNSRVFVLDRIKELRNRSEVEEDSARRRLARRVLIGVLIGSIETARSLAVKLSYRSAASFYELAAAIRPRDPEIAYELARMYALDGRKKTAVETLANAVAVGFKDWARVRKDPAFTGLAADPRFQKLLQQGP